MNSMMSALRTMVVSSLDPLADWVPEVFASRVEMLSRHRRLVLIACGETGLSRLLSNAGKEGLSFEQIQAGVALTPTSLRLLLVLACSFKLLRLDRRSLRYRAMRRLRVETPPQLYQLLDAAPAFLSESIRTGTNAALRVLPGPGTTLYERLESYPELEQHYAASLARANVAIRLPLVLEAIRRLGSEVSHVLDIGGNIGVTAAAIAERYPHIRVTVFDLPSVCATGRAQCQHKSVDFVDGNLADASLPVGADCVLLSAVLEVTPVGQARLLMRRIHEALPPGGSVIVVQGAIDELEPNPLPSARAALYFFNVCAPSPMSLCTGDMRALAKESGFASFEIHRLNRGPLAVMTMRK